MATIEEQIDAAVELGYLQQGDFLQTELADMLKNEEIAKAFYEVLDECSCCGRVWPLDSMEDSNQMDGLICHYCVSDENEEDDE
jgi:hypothetical protein